MQVNNPATLEQKPRAVIFDVDNTLYEYADAHQAGMDAARGKACAALGIDGATFDVAFKTARAEIKKRLGKVASAHSRLLYFQRLVEKLGQKTRISLTLELEQAYWRAFMMRARLRRGAVDFLHDVRAIGATTAVLTDLTAQIQLRKIIFFGLEGLFDLVTTSEEAGTDKPDLAPFDLMKEKLALPPDAVIWMVGDDACDLLAKDVMGAFTFLLRGHEDAAKADVVFSDFAELRSIVGRWAGSEVNS